MIFQTFDDKKNCYAIYANNKIYSKGAPSRLNLTSTWDYSEFLRDKDILYAKYYCGGKPLSEICPEHLKGEWKSVFNKLKAFYRSINETKLNLSEHCFYDMLPSYILLEYGKIKNKICSYIFENYEKPLDYKFKVELTKVLTEMKNKKLNIDLLAMKSRRHEFKVRQFIKKIKETPPFVVYDACGTKTGRLTSKKFPILTMDKSFRKILKPNNSWFLELDYNAAELRVLLGLLDTEQPKEDIHTWNLQNVYKGIGTREKAKKRIFAWLYNPKSKDYISSRVYNREELLEKYWDGEYVKTYFNREIKADEKHALNYIVQSTAADLFLRQMIKVWEYLKDKKSYIAFCLHDSLVIDLHTEDEMQINDIKEIFEDTELGKFKVNSYGGKNFKDMKRLNVK